MHPQDDTDWPILFTGVDPEYRGRNLARVAKSHLHAAGIQRGATGFVTWNEEINEPIRKLNAAMNFRKTGGEYRLKRVPTGS